MPEKIFNNLLLTFKKTGEKDFETLYVSKGFFKIFDDPLRSYQVDFFDQVFPTVQNPVFQTIYDYLGRAEVLEIPFFINENSFTWVKIEGFTMAQEDGSYLVNATIDPIRPAQVQSCWIVQAIRKQIYTDVSNPSGYFPSNLEAFCRYLNDKYRFTDPGKLKQLCEGRINGLVLDLDILRLDNQALDNGYHLLSLKTNPERAGFPNLIEEDSKYLTNSFLDIIYFEYLKEDREMIWSGAINELLGYQENRFRRFSIWDWLEIIHPDDRNKVRDVFFAERYEKDAYTYTYRVRNKRGEYLHLKNSLKVFYNIAAKKTILVGILNDVSDINKAQKHLKEKEGILQNLSEKEYIQQALQEVSEISSLFKGLTLFDEITQLIYKKLGFTYCMVAHINPVNHNYELISLRKNGKKLQNSSAKWTKFINSQLYELDPQSSFLIKDSSDPDFYSSGTFFIKNGLAALIRLDLFDKNRIKIGTLCFLNEKPLINKPLYGELFRILGDWISKELLRYRFESALQETNFMHDAILNGTAYAIFAVNHQFEIILINNKTLPVFNLKKKDQLMDTVLLKDGKKESLRKVITRFAQSKKSTAYYLLPTKTDHKELKISFTRIQYGRKHKVSYVVFVDDITDRTHSEKKLIASEQLYRSIAENFPRGTIDVLDKSFNYIFTDGEEYRMSGIDPKSLIGTNHLQLYSGDNLMLTEKNLKRILKGKTVSYEIEANQQKFLKIGVPLTNDAGTTDRILLVKQNITEAKKLEAEREKLIKDLKSHNEELLRFAYIVSHNLRAPIVNISLLIDLFNEEDPADPENKEVLENLKISTSLLDATLQDLIEVVSIKKQKIPKVELIDFKMLLNNVEKSLFNQLKESGISIHKDFSAMQEMNYVYAHLENFFMNFMTNAVKYKHPDRTPEVWISTYREQQYCVIRFEDNGIGLDLSRYGDRIFGLYQRFHNHVEGKGLGLYLVREQIRANDGRITVESEVGKGTVFKVYLRNLILNPNHNPDSATSTFTS